MMEGAYNFRDLGGLPTRDGRTVRTGRLYRSDTLQALTLQDAKHLHDVLGLRGIVDLRLASEVAEEGRGPLSEFADIRYVNAPLEVAATDGVPPEQVMRHLYLGCLAPGSSLITAVGHLCELSDQPILFHCAAGKDRTGMLAALVLRLLGVDDEAIVADYMRSDAAMPRMIERFATWPRYRAHMALAPAQAYRVEEEPIRQFLQHLDHTLGGAQAWIESSGIPRSSLERLVTNLL